MSRIDRVFSAGDREQVEKAVREAEQQTGGEIVPFAVERSDSYEGASWLAAALGSLLFSLATALFHRWADLWTVPLVVWIAFPPAAGAALGFLSSEMFAPVKRALIAKAELAERVAERAAQAFLSEQVFATRDRTGVLIFVSLFERRVVVLADSGINARVCQEDWDGVVAGVVAAMRAGEIGKALADGIRRCGGILAEHRVERRSDDRDELADGLRLRDS
jgi:putative membrane protein